MKCVKEDRIPLQVVPMQALQYNNQKTTECNVFLSRLVAELAENLPTGNLSKLFGGHGRKTFPN
jgi:hypothetical protein